MALLRQGFERVNQMKKKSKQFPKNYRTITDPLRQIFSEARRFKKFRKNNLKLLEKLKLEGIIFIYAITIFLILISAFDLFSNFQKQKEINFETEKIQSEIKLWQEVTNKFKDYKEAYYQLAILEYRLGETDLAKFYIDKSLYLDPNFEKARELRKILYSY